jgi:hypothetical protein
MKGATEAEIATLERMVAADTKGGAQKQSGNFTS